MADSVFRGTIEFLGEVGLYDIVLPFLLVFTIMFAILEKTKILGIEKVNDKEYAKKNLNAIVAFSTAFLVIASTRLVAIINDVIANIVLLLILAISFLLLVGAFMGDHEFSLKDHPGWVTFFMVAMLVGIVLIFLNALGWLEYVTNLFTYWRGEWASTIIFIAIIVGFMALVVFGGGNSGSSSSKEKKKE